MDQSRYLVLAFDLASDGSFINQGCRSASTLAAALLIGARGNLASGGVLILQAKGRVVEVIAKCGLAENPSVAAYAEADVRFGLWPMSADCADTTSERFRA